VRVVDVALIPGLAGARAKGAKRLKSHKRMFGNIFIFTCNYLTVVLSKNCRQDCVREDLSLPFFASRCECHLARVMGIRPH
jgi:hypothetical protein